LEYQRHRTKSKDVAYSLYLYFLGLSYRNTAKALDQFEERRHVSIWKWIQKYKPQKISFKRKKIEKFIIDETQVKVGSQYIWLWVSIEPKHRQVLHIDIYFERNMLIVSEHFLSSLIDKYGKHRISTDGGTWYPPQACKFLKLKHHTHSPFEKSIIETTILKYINDRIKEGFDDYFPYSRRKKKNCKLPHVKQWFNLLIDQHHKSISS
jgi:putative transposase